MDLNTEQKKAVRTTKGKVLILAGAGSGKTSVLVQRIAYLIEELYIDPKSILGLTFTNKAAQEMRQRVAQRIGLKNSKAVTLSTFHSFCIHILRQEIHLLGYTNQFSLYDEQDIKRLTKNLIGHMLEHEGELPSLESTLTKVFLLKSQNLSVNVEESKNLTWHDQFSKELVQRLEICLRAYNAVDFDSLLSLTVKLFEQFPLVLERYQERFQYIMIDEYQDTNQVQYRLATLLAKKHQNLCVVGDDDQSIYGWRGAEIKNILNFEHATVIKLEQNYRSTPIILKAANALISHNRERHEKRLWSTSESKESITLFHAPTEQDEADSVVERMIRLHQEQGISWEDMAILYRSNILSRPFEFSLKQAVWKKEDQWIRGIPYQVIGGTDFFERSEIKDLIAFLNVILNPLDQESLLRIINVPRRGISDKTLDLLTQFNRSQNIPLWDILKDISCELTRFQQLKQELSERALKGISSFVSIIEKAADRFHHEPLHLALHSFLTDINYKQAIHEEVKSEQMRHFKWENISYCVQALIDYEEQKKNEGLTTEISLHNFLSDILLDQQNFPYKETTKKKDKVNLMTFHSAKGLEFTACFLVCLEDHIIPHEKSLLQENLEEERRLMYVGITRAKQYLTLSMARKRKKLGKEFSCKPSRFLFEIPQELLDIIPWKAR